jgi:HD-GYP domain-containing protein (c-di-GMP phosphodiesterase class II)
MFSEARMGRVTEIEKAGALVDQIAASVIRNQHALVALSRLKNADYTYMHSVAVCAMMIALARQLQLSDDEVRYVARRACCTISARWLCRSGF